MIPGDYVHTFGDVHIYENHKDAVEEQLRRTPSELPTLIITDSKLSSSMNIENVDLWAPEMFEIKNYNPQSQIKAELSTGLKNI